MLQDAFCFIFCLISDTGATLCIVLSRAILVINILRTNRHIKKIWVGGGWYNLPTEMKDSSKTKISFLYAQNMHEQPIYALMMQILNRLIKHILILIRQSFLHHKSVQMHKHVSEGRFPKIHNLAFGASFCGFIHIYRHQTKKVRRIFFVFFSSVGFRGRVERFRFDLSCP